jgi:hypothetical protein
MCAQIGNLHRAPQPSIDPDSSFIRARGRIYGEMPSKEHGRTPKLHFRVLPISDIAVFNSTEFGAYTLAYGRTADPFGRGLPLCTLKAQILWRIRLSQRSLKPRLDRAGFLPVSD